MSRPKVEVIAGINLPMLIKLARVRDERRSPRPSPTPRTPAANTSPSPARCSPANERRRQRTAIRRASAPVVRDLEIINKRGLHARASAKFVQMVEHFDAEVTVTRGHETVGGTSIMGLMMLAAAPGTSITVMRPAAQAAEVLDALER